MHGYNESNDAVNIAFKFFNTDLKQLLDRGMRFEEPQNSDSSSDDSSSEEESDEV